MIDALIIGGGFSGLAAGIRLAHFDLKVCLIESHPVPGGLNTFYPYKGYLFESGLHAVTNFPSPKNTKTPFWKLLRQLRLTADDFALRPQKKSRICFPGACLEFTNDFPFFITQVEQTFPEERDRFLSFISYLNGFDEYDFSTPYLSTRYVLSSFIHEPLLIEMLLCPVMYYGSAQENDLDFKDFALLFKSIFFEGLGRPEGGIKSIIDLLVNRFTECGGELRLNTTVNALEHDGHQIMRAHIQNGEPIESRHVFSSAGLWETMRLTGQETPHEKTGRISFMESISIFNTPLQGKDTSILFYNDHPSFAYKQPEGLTDPSSGVVCFPDHFHYETPLDSFTVKITHLANYSIWRALSTSEYSFEKEKTFRSACHHVSRYLPDLDFSRNMAFSDIFTPLTIEKFTHHMNGSVYGSPVKKREGKTAFDNLYLCGTDQGLVGIVGSMLSGITMANQHVLSKINS
ncbi:MAG: NAD(P)/FAD-dependent oxidoreductase [Candidatus Aureabacteria bacterium]|nr:NAD(P)/FAD-dependent oxidoreductase [Candidatus Auribacterota bacterium]